MKVYLLGVYHDGHLHVSAHTDAVDRLTALRINFAEDEPDVTDDELVGYVESEGVVVHLDEHDLWFDTDEFFKHLVEGHAAAQGDSNDAEIEAWTFAAEEAANLLGVDFGEAREEGSALAQRREDSE